MEMRNLLIGEVQAELEALEQIEVGTKEHQTAVDCVTKLMDRCIEMDKLDIEHQERVEAREEEQKFKMEQMKSEKRDRIFKNGIAVGSLVLPLGVTIWGVLKSFEFEKEGTVTTIMGRGLVQKLLPGRK